MVRSLILNAENKISGNISDFSGLKLPKQDNYETALREAAVALQKRQINDIANKSGTSIISIDFKDYLLVPFLNDELIVSHPDISIKYKDNNAKEVQLWLKILLLHYLEYAKGNSTTGNQITFKGVTGGLGYYTAFQRRSISPILKTFGNNFENFISAGERIGGIRQPGKYSIYFQAFPRVGIYFNIWDQDEDFPAEGNIIFDSSISNFLTSEDIAVLCNMIAVMIVKNKQ
jgi:hypothetical protein